MRGRGQAASLDREWDEVWAEHDARRAQRFDAVPAPAVLPARPAPAPLAVRGGGGRWALAAFLLLLPILWAAGPIVTAWQAAKALQAGDVEGFARHVDQAAVGDEVRLRLAEVTARVPDGPANAFLAAMADDIARTWSSPSVAASSARPVGTAPRVQSVGLTSFEIELDARPAPMSLRFGLRDGGLLPRWQVTGIRVELPVQGFGTPPAWLSAR